MLHHQLHGRLIISLRTRLRINLTSLAEATQRTLHPKAALGLVAEPAAPQRTTGAGQSQSASSEYFHLAPLLLRVTL